MEHGIAGWFLDRLHENLAVLKEAPEAIALVAIAVGLIVYFAVDKLHSERFAVLNERIASLNEQVAAYRGKLQGATPDEAAREMADLQQRLDKAQKQIEALAAPPSLTPPQQKLLSLLARYQRQYSVTKLIVLRGRGTLHFDEDPDKGKDVNLIRDLYGSDQAQNPSEFENLMESMPAYYVKLLPEMRLDSPFVVSVTEAGFDWLGKHQP
jgi:hypothetical protein